MRYDDGCWVWSLIIGATELPWRTSLDAATEEGDREWQDEHSFEYVFLATQVVF